MEEAERILELEENFNNTDMYANAAFVAPHENYEKCDYRAMYVPPQLMCSSDWLRYAATDSS